MRRGTLELHWLSDDQTVSATITKEVSEKDYEFIVKLLEKIMNW
jgi:hypothetical protein